MSYENFLTSTYFGRLNNAAFDSFQDLKTDAKTRKIIDDYLKVSRQYPEHQIEEKGTLSKALLRKLVSLGLISPLPMVAWD